MRCIPRAYASERLRNGSPDRRNDLACRRTIEPLKRATGGQTLRPDARGGLHRR
jgi:hypothetical protein